MTETLEIALNVEIENLIDDIKNEQIDCVISNGKYKQIALAKTETMTYEVHEYVSNIGIGFTCIFRATEDEIDYIKTVGFGVESDSRTNDWQEVIEDLT